MSALLTVALAVTALYLLFKGPSDSDPEVLFQKAREAGNAITNPNHPLGWDSIRENYREMIEKKYINTEKLRDVLHQDVEQLSYPHLIQKHFGNGLQQDFVDFLFPASKTLLEEKFLQYVASKASQSTVEIKGANDTTRAFSSECLVLGDHMLPRVTTVLFAADEQHFMAGSLDYAQMRARNGYKRIAEVFNKTSTTDSDAFKSELRKKFLKMPHSQIYSPVYEQDRILMDIKAQEVVDEITNFAAEHPYLGENNFRNTHGVEALVQNQVSIEMQNKYKSEVIDHIASAPKLTIDEFKKELDYFKLSRNDLLKQRWANKSLPDMDAQEKRTFFNEASSCYTPHELKEKTLKDIQGRTISQIKGISPDIFTKQIVQAHDAATVGTGTIADQVEREMATIQTLEEFFKVYDTVLFESKLLKKESVKLQTLILNYVDSNKLAVIDQDVTVKGIWEKLHRYQHIPEKMTQALTTAQAEVQGERERHHARLTEIHSFFQVNMTATSKGKEAAVKNVERHPDVLSAQENLTKASTAYAEIKKTYDAAAETFRVKSDELRNTCARQGEVLAKYQALNGKMAAMQQQVQRLPALHAEINHVGDTLLRHQNAVVMCQAEISRHQQALVAIQSNLTNVNLQGAEAQVADMQQRETRAQTAFQTHYQQLGRMKKELPGMHLQIQQLEVEVKSLELAWQGETSGLATARATLMRVQQEHQGLIRNKEIYEKAIANLSRTEQISELIARKQTLEQEFLRLNQEQQSIPTLQVELVGMTRECDLLNRLISSLQGEEQRAQAQKDQLQGSVALAKRHLDAMQQAFDGMQEWCKQQKTEIHNRFAQEKRLHDGKLFEDEAKEAKKHQDGMQVIIENFGLVISK